MRCRWEVGVLAAAVALVACSPASPSAGLDPDAVVLRVERGSASIHDGTAPILVYGDGRVVTRPIPVEFNPAALVDPVQRRLSPEALDEVLSLALEAGLDEPRTVAGPTPVIGELPFTTFTVDDGTESRVVVEAMGRYFLGQETPWELRDGRLRLLDLYERIHHLADWLPPGAIGEEEPAPFAQLRVISSPVPFQVFPPGPREIDWPLGRLVEFGRPFAGPPGMPAGLPSISTRCAVVEGEDLERLLELVRTAEHDDKWVSEGVVFNASFTALLEAESGCPEELLE